MADTFNLSNLALATAWVLAVLSGTAGPVQAGASIDIRNCGSNAIRVCTYDEDDTARSVEADQVEIRKGDAGSVGCRSGGCVVKVVDPAGSCRTRFTLMERKSGGAYHWRPSGALISAGSAYQPCP